MYYLLDCYTQDGDYYYLPNIQADAPGILMAATGPKKKRKKSR